MFAEIILSRRFPKHMGIFDYGIPETLVTKIVIGQLVTIPFRKSAIEGVVVKIKKTGIVGKRIKEITDIKQADPIITPEQIQFAEWMSQYYWISLGTIIKMMLPPIPKRSSQKKPEGFDLLQIPKPSIEINEQINSLIQSKINISLFQPNNELQKMQFIYGLSRKIKGNKLFIVPTIEHINKLAALLPKSIQKKTAIIHSKLNKNEFYKSYNLILQNKAEITIGTKLSIFAPLRDLKLIVIDHEEDDNHKQADQNPRFDVRLAVQKLNKIHSSKVVYISPSPTANAYYQISKNNFKHLKSHKSTNGHISVVNMKDEKDRRNFSIFSEILQLSIANCLDSNKKVFLFINKRGSSSSVMCQDCGSTHNCAKCGQPLIYHEKNSALFCHSCNLKSKLPPYCPKCSGTNFKFMGSGTQKTETEARKLWPQALIIRYDKDQSDKKILADFDICIGTSGAFDVLDWKQIGLVGVVSADTFLYLPDFRSAERTWHVLKKIDYLSDSPIIIQTYNIKHHLFGNLIRNEQKQFYLHELKERQLLQYPPYANLIKLTYQNTNKEQCLKEAQRLYKALRTSSLGISIVTPLKPLKFGKWHMHVIIKYPADFPENELKNIISTVPDTWIIDRDPVSLL